MALKRKIDISDHEALTLLARQLRMRLEPVDDGERLVVDGQDIDRHLRAGAGRARGLPGVDGPGG